MESFQGKLAVLTGGGTGMGRELVRQLVGDGCAVAMCDVSQQNMDETRALCSQNNPGSVTISTHICDVSDAAAVRALPDAVIAAHSLNKSQPVANLLFNNAGIGGGGSFIEGDVDEWQRCFDVCWQGVYNISRAFVPMLVASDEGHIVNTSSVNGFWATLGSGVAHTSYSAAKFAVKGFTEALITDCRLHAPHVGVSLVMPGHIGTSIALNSGKVLGRGEPMEMSSEEIAKTRAYMIKRGLPVDNVPDDHIRGLLQQQALDFRDKAPTTATQAATIILDGVRANRWRILVGEDAQELDRLVRADPENAYEDSVIMEQMRQAGHFGGLTSSVSVGGADGD